MARQIKAVKSGKITITDKVEEIYERKVTLYGNGAKIDAPKRYISKRVYMIILKN